MSGEASSLVGWTIALGFALVAGACIYAYGWVGVMGVGIGLYAFGVVASLSDHEGHR